MKHLFNDMDNSEKRRILEQHRGGIEVNTQYFRKLLTKKLGEVKPLIGEQETQQDQQPKKEVKTITNKIASEGIKNVTSQMISSPAFPGALSGGAIMGEFGGVNYIWDMSGVEGCPTIRGREEGVILSENNSYLLTDKEAMVKIGANDANPKGVFVGFVGQNNKFVLYFTNKNSYKCKDTA